MESWSGLPLLRGCEKRSSRISVEGSQPDIAHRDLARLALDLEANKPRLVIDGVFVVINEDGHQLTVHDVHHDAAAGDDLVVVPFVHLHVAAQGLLVTDGCDKAVGLPGERLRYLAAIGEDALHGVFGIPLAGVGGSSCRDGKPEIGLRTRHHEFPVVRWLALGLLPGPWQAGEAAVLDAASTTLFNFHLQLEVE